jgi:hypothetical protein
MSDVEEGLEEGEIENCDSGKRRPANTESPECL